MSNANLQFALPASALPASALPASALDDADLIEQLNLADRADWLLLRLVGCTALSTLLLATALALTH